MDMDTVTSTKPARRLHGPLLFSVLTALLCTLFLEALDNTIVGPALPHIISQLVNALRRGHFLTSEVSFCPPT
ncbi:MAG: hypothetical protein M3Y81_02105 [Chloroflexota bacterium]|nr:hypothetical protein [Chloroflexota bacterium]